MPYCRAMASLEVIECFVEPPDEVTSGADFLAEAVEAIKAGRRDDAASALQRLDAEAFAATWITGGMIAGARHHPDLHPPKHLGKAARAIPKAVRREVAERDGWRCRYCCWPTLRMRMAATRLFSMVDAHGVAAVPRAVVGVLRLSAVRRSRWPSGRAEARRVRGG